VSDAVLDGGCLCGAVRYRARGPALRVNHCHCAMCRRTTGAVAATWATVALDGFALAAGKPAEYRASPKATRAFCATCGSTQFWKRDGADTIDIAVGTLDAPGDLAATRHDFVEERLACFALDPHLPEFPGTT
jgi:hypothetical protein